MLFIGDVSVPFLQKEYKCFFVLISIDAGTVCSLLYFDMFLFILKYIQISLSFCVIVSLAQ